MVTIRPATLDDVPAITAIYNEAVRTTTASFDCEEKTVEERRRWFEAHDDRHPIIVAEKDGEVVGWAALSPWSERDAYAETAESSFYVGADYRGQGIGRQLKEGILAAGREAGLHTVIARIAEGNQASIHLNESCGFEHIGTMKEVGRKFRKRLDVYLMQYIYRDE